LEVYQLDTVLAFCASIGLIELRLIWSRNKKVASACKGLLQKF